MTSRINLGKEDPKQASFPEPPHGAEETLQNSMQGLWCGSMVKPLPGALVGVL